jgi:hypothetical protein
MNEKIAEFTRQSGLDIILNEHAGEFGDGIVDSTYYPQVEKFAELIIQECYQAVRGRCDGVLEDEEMMKDHYWKGYVSGVCDASIEIRLCFDSVDFDH